MSCFAAQITTAIKCDHSAGHHKTVYV